jgi:hypothetical protein
VTPLPSELPCGLATDAVSTLFVMFVNNLFLLLLQCFLPRGSLLTSPSTYLALVSAIVYVSPFDIVRLCSNFTFLILASLVCDSLSLEARSNLLPGTLGFSVRGKPLANNNYKP